MDIPWREKNRFDEALGFLMFMDRCCRLTCPGCSDNCCARATIWYDFRDFLYLYFSPGRMPDRQILKDPERSGCPNLNRTGCVLPDYSRVRKWAAGG